MSIFKGFNIFPKPKAKVEAVSSASLPVGAEEQAAADALLARATALPAQRNELYDHLMSIRERLRKDSTAGPCERGIEDRRFQTFALSFAETPEPHYSRYAANPETFGALEKRFRFSVFALESSVPYEPGRAYTTREGSVREPLTGQSQYLDAPYAFALGYEKEDGNFEILSTISFIPDYAKQIILVDQLQGGDTAHHRASKEGKRVRMKFATPPEEILYEAVLGLALRAGYRGVALRKSRSNQWGKVAQDNIPVEERRLTPYDRLAASRELRGFAHGDYYLEPVVSPAAEMPSLTEETP